ncbi:MAG TPA: hypothetical protein DDZ67_11165 [Xanthomonadaceae bacterium]|nr:hypothetical protein [Xanthomonadaceae bacterium]
MVRCFRSALLSSFLLCLALVLSGCGGGSSGSANAGTPADGGTPAPAPDPDPAPTPDPDPAPSPTRSIKRGVAYDLATPEDMKALSSGVTWWYNWSPTPHPGSDGYAGVYGMDFIPMLWNDDFDDAGIEARLRANPSIRYLLLLNEPNLADQANMTPQRAAALWPRYEALAERTGVQLVGPAITWGTLSGFEDPVVWLDAFYAAYRNAHGGAAPRIDYLAFHWYDYGLAGQLDRLGKYGKRIWVTEFANWHSGDGSAQIDTVAKQMQQMTEMVEVCEQREDVFRYAWFTGRWTRDGDPHKTSLLAGNGELTELGRHYVSLPFTAAAGVSGP